MTGNLVAWLADGNSSLSSYDDGSDIPEGHDIGINLGK